MLINDPIPAKMYTQDVLQRVGVCHTTWKTMIKKGEAPAHRYRGKGGNVYLGSDIARFLGLIEQEKGIGDNDPFVKGAERLGKIKRR